MIECGLRHATGSKGGLVKERVRLDGLLLSSDTQVLRVMNQVLNSFAIKTEVCAEIGPALDAVTHRRLDTVIVDWNIANDPTRVVRSARKSSPNSNSTIVAMVDMGSATHALLVGAHFMIYQPVHEGGIRNHASRASAGCSSLGRHPSDGESFRTRDS